MLCLQNGRFDSPDRMFHSLADSWDSCIHNPADLKELIPEFFTGAGDFLINGEDLDLGHKHCGERVHDVVLPPWAESPRDFTRKHIKALECDYVSDHIHEWIDLIFGYKQRGQAAIEADNLYYYLTYEGAVDLEAIKDVRERAALESQIQEFGQTPKQLFAGPHPARSELNAPIPVSISLSGLPRQATTSSPMPTPISTISSSPSQLPVTLVNGM
jgi:factor associated with neutral sphingomyelinase activation